MSDKWRGDKIILFIFLLSCTYIQWFTGSSSPGLWGGFPWSCGSSISSSVSTDFSLVSVHSADPRGGQKPRGVVCRKDNKSSPGPNRSAGPYLTFEIPACLTHTNARLKTRVENKGLESVVVEWGGKRPQTVLFLNLQVFQWSKVKQSIS